MNLMMIYITGVLVSLALTHQERRHRFELQLEYERLGKTLPPVQPKLSLSVSWQNVIVGAVVFIFGMVFLITFIKAFALGDPRLSVMEPFELAAVFLATGMALIVLGAKSILEHRRRAKSGQQA